MDIKQTLLEKNDESCLTWLCAFFSKAEHNWSELFLFSFYMGQFYDVLRPERMKIYESIVPKDYLESVQ